jgi:hypothetical protein
MAACPSKAATRRRPSTAAAASKRRPIEDATGAFTPRAICRSATSRSRGSTPWNASSKAEER